MISTSAPSSTVFIGNLSVSCTERDLLALFCQFGMIEFIKIKRKGPETAKATHSSYCFLKYSTMEAAESALLSLDGVVFQGRPLRLGWASDRTGANCSPSFDQPPASSKHQYQQQAKFPEFIPKMFVPPQSNSFGNSSNTVFHSNKHAAPRSNVAEMATAQIHFLYHCPLDHRAILEDELRTMFSQFGQVVDVIIKKVDRNMEKRMLAVYGFIHYPMSANGISACSQAISAMHNTIIDGCIYFQCNSSHSLERYLQDQQKRKIVQSSNSGFASAFAQPLPSYHPFRPSSPSHQQQQYPTMMETYERSSSPDSTSSTLSSHSSLFPSDSPSSSPSSSNNSSFFFSPSSSSAAPSKHSAFSAFQPISPSLLTHKQAGERGILDDLNIDAAEYHEQQQQMIISHIELDLGL